MLEVSWRFTRTKQNKQKPLSKFASWGWKLAVEASAKEGMKNDTILLSALFCGVTSGCLSISISIQSLRCIGFLMLCELNLKWYKVINQVLWSEMLPSSGICNHPCFILLDEMIQHFMVNACQCSIKTIKVLKNNQNNTWHNEFPHELQCFNHPTSAQDLISCIPDPTL